MKDVKQSEQSATADQVDRVVRRRIASMMLFANGKIVAFDESDQQIPEMQIRSAIELWAEYASASGFDVVGCKISTQQPGGAGASGTVIECFDGFDELWD